MAQPAICARRCIKLRDKGLYVQQDPGIATAPLAIQSGGQGLNCAHGEKADEGAPVIEFSTKYMAIAKLAGINGAT